MSVTVRFLHARPQAEIAMMIWSRLAKCERALIVTGFATPDGLDALQARKAANKITRLIIGSATFKAFEALDRLIAAGMRQTAAKVHLGHDRGIRGRGKGKSFGRFRPMLHSKIYLFENSDGTSAAFVGSHNLTGFALRGVNGEAGVLLEGQTSESEFNEVRAHIQESYNQAVVYDKTMKEAYAKWYASDLSRLSSKIGEIPNDIKQKNTFILLAEQSSATPPSVGDAIYFELDKKIKEIKSISVEVHIILFFKLPSTPHRALGNRSDWLHRFVASVEAIDSGAGSAEVKAQWFIEDKGTSTLKRASPRFRPIPRSENQQIRVKIKKNLRETYDYFPKDDTINWEPTFGERASFDDETELGWYSVTGFKPQEGHARNSKDNLAREMTPESGSFILFSQTRRKDLEG